MGEEDAISEKQEPVANGKVECDEKAEAMKNKIEGQHDGVTKTKDDKQDKEKYEAMQMDVDKEGKAGEDDVLKEVGNKSEELKKQKSSRKRPRSKTSVVRKDKAKEKKPAEEEKEQKPPTQKKDKEPKTSVQKKENKPKIPSAFPSDRPVREKKSVARLVDTSEKRSRKEFHIEKGRGTALKDIPNVAYKLSREKAEGTIKLLYSILIGRRIVKVAQMKIHISRFSGFVWHDNEEKEKDRVREKLDKVVKEKLIELCNVLDVPVSKNNSRKEDIITKLLDFLMEPHATTTELLAEKEQAMKRKRPYKSASGSSAPSNGSAKRRKEANSSSSGSDNVSVSEEAKEEDMNGAQEISDVLSKQVANEGKRSESEEESDEDNGKKKPGSTKSSKLEGTFEEVKTKDGNESEEESDEDKCQKKPRAAKSSTSKGLSVIVIESEEESDDDKGEKQGLVNSSIMKGSPEKAKTNKATISRKTSPPPKSLPAKSPDHTKSNNGPSANKCSFKKDEAVKKRQAPIKSQSNEGPVKKVLKRKQKPKESVGPSDNEVRYHICKMLKKIDFNKVTLNDILKILGKEFNIDLRPRRATIRGMIADELQREADEAAKLRRESVKHVESSGQKKAESDSKKGGGASSNSSGSDNISEEAKEKDMNGNHERSEELSANEGEKSESEEESDEYIGEKQALVSHSMMKGSSEKAKTNKGIIPRKISPPPKSLPTTSPRNSKSNNPSANNSSAKKDEAVKKPPAPIKSLAYEGRYIGRRVLRGRQKPKKEPSDDEVRNYIRRILKETDDMVLNLTKILIILGREFNTDLSPRRAAIKAMVADELRREAEEG